MSVAVLEGAPILDEAPPLGDQKEAIQSWTVVGARASKRMFDRKEVGGKLKNLALRRRVVLFLARHPLNAILGRDNLIQTCSGKSKKKMSL